MGLVGLEGVLSAPNQSQISNYLEKPYFLIHLLPRN